MALPAARVGRGRSLDRRHDRLQAGTSLAKPNLIDARRWPPLTGGVTPTGHTRPAAPRTTGSPPRWARSPRSPEACHPGDADLSARVALVFTRPR
ncbi:hypothetical protein FRAAL4172 [Frankia alni ACN14a]|uniref:Uncharacterized protein n=1 Tax=Frankia alni (strain DSM 45986 / CECT 9034 / ACN14a) TaxID=326424 RepID=Q0RI57_FRAAA|nr:hypothetical protein FRAAL4172 [Frankia alni ACN14a]